MLKGGVKVRANIADPVGTHLPFAAISSACFHAVRISWANAMRITGNKPVTGVQGRGARKKAASDGSAFTPAMGDDAPQSSAMSGGAAIQGMDALLTLQEIVDEPDRRSKATKRGHVLLDGLEAMRTDLLGGFVKEGRLEALSHELSEHESSGDPDVDSVIDEIELRVKVELAKLGRFPD